MDFKSATIFDSENRPKLVEAYPDLPEDQKRQVFDTYIQNYSKDYKNDAEKERRFKQFSKNVDYIRNHNRSNAGYTQTINKFADYTEEEMERGY